jgi:hypothetical protein
LGTTKKPLSKANLYRARRRLRHSLDRADSVFRAPGRDIPESWDRPDYRAGTRNRPDAGPHAIGLASPVPEGSRIAIGTAIEGIRIQIPQSIRTNSISVEAYCDSRLVSRSNLPIPESGIVETFVVADKSMRNGQFLILRVECDGQSSEIRWPIGRDEP